MFCAKTTHEIWQQLGLEINKRVGLKVNKGVGSESIGRGAHFGGHEGNTTHLLVGARGS